MDDNIFEKINFLNLGEPNSTTNLFGNIKQKFQFNEEHDDEENEIIVYDDKTELSQIKEQDNDSRSVTEYANKSRKESQLNLRENLNINKNEEKKEEEFLRPHDINLNKKNENNFNNNIFNNNLNNRELDFEDKVNKKYGLFPII